MELYVDALFALVNDQRKNAIEVGPDPHHLPLEPGKAVGIFTKGSGELTPIAVIGQISDEHDQATYWGLGLNSELGWAIPCGRFGLNMAVFTNPDNGYRCGVWKTTPISRFVPPSKLSIVRVENHADLWWDDRISSILANGGRKGEVTLGRSIDEPNAMALTENIHASRRHIRLIIGGTEGGLEVQDLNSSNGTWVGNGRLISKL